MMKGLQGSDSLHPRRIRDAQVAKDWRQAGEAESSWSRAEVCCYSLAWTRSGLIYSHNLSLSLSSFLSPLRRRHGSSTDQAKIVTTPKSQPSSPHTSITANMLGQPPTMLDGGGAGGTDFAAYSDPLSEGSDPDTEILLRRIYGPDLATQDVAQVVMDERLDERDGLLMDGELALVGGLSYPANWPRSSSAGLAASE